MSAVTIALARAKARGERGSCQWVLDNPDKFELVFEQIEYGNHSESLRQLCVEALRVACKEQITDADYRQVGRIAERMVKDAALKVSNNYPEDDDD